MFFRTLFLTLIAAFALSVVACSAPDDSPPVSSDLPNEVSDKADDVIRIALDRGNPPFMYEDNGQPAGLYPLLLEAAFEEMDVDVQIEVVPWKRALATGESGETGVGGIYKNEERLQIYDYSEPLYAERLMLYVREGSEFEFNDVSDLEGKVIGAILGWSYGDAFDNARSDGLFEVEEVPDDEANFQKLILGRVDAVIAIEVASNQLLPQIDGGDTVTALEVPLAVNETYLVFAKSTEREALLERFNETIEAMKEDGRFDEIASSFD
jgi:polar amino acid transport system substrate-binding protein